MTIKTAKDYTSHEDFNNAMVSVMAFLVPASEDSVIYGLERAEDVLENFRVIVGWDKDHFDKVCKIFSTKDEDDDKL